ncbi:UDP-N-acetylmuramoyl-tripeptide--D-alanyl-D-alanine ligase [Nocardioides caldifontis]|uniref:UDP-N-acetylmuramoyl-tripeptide--D-alanyl-D- alanine ligase n=1 Tax=Nocardioides caldifontis TaxID=2588938 RepID=UPI0011DF98BE|nr:UDP-N-acetylmuramoyl-tripeptide--D-alanyl-D-alanine ligase [Nocardioides caldifontis]
MTPMTLAQLSEVVGGTVHDAEDGGTGLRVTGPATIDSRAVEPGGLFAAFVGEHVDGHDYAASAVEAGAAAVLGSRPVGVPSVVVDDPGAALTALARHVLARLPDVQVLAVTGSQGKTSTKDLLAAVLADAAPTVATRGSFNNELGLPLTVLRADPGTRFLLLEMGARGIGHIRTLCEVARPDVAMVLNVGKAHLGEFGTQADIARAKGELVEALPGDGVAVLNGDDPLVDAMASRTDARVLRFGSTAGADLRWSDVRLDERGHASVVLQHAGERVPVALQLVGEHMAVNAAAAAAAALSVGVPLADAARSLSAVRTLSQWRMEVHERGDGVTVVNDAYNANPDSMAAALKALVAIGGGARARRRRTIAVLGEMKELGESGEAEHEAVGRLAVRLGVDRVVAVGAPARAIGEGARAEAGSGEERAVFVDDNEAAVALLRGELRDGDVVLLKASRGARLDLVAAAVLDQGLDDGAGR